MKYLQSSLIRNLIGIFTLIMVVSPVISLDIQVQDITNGHANWQFRQASKDQWYPANVPSTVHMDLMTNGLLDDPYYRDNLMKAYWIEVEDWEYKTQFKVSQDILNKQVVEMVFEGLDTHATVNLNGQDILKANNMHRTWVIDVKNVLSKDAINNITIHFNSAPLHDLQAADDLNKSMGIVLPFIIYYTKINQLPFLQLLIFKKSILPVRMGLGSKTGNLWSMEANQDQSF